MEAQNEKQTAIRQKDFYRERIVEMVKKIKSERFIKMIYAYTKSLLEEETGEG